MQFASSAKVATAAFILAAFTAVSPASARDGEDTVLMAAKFDPRPVAKIEAGDFHFLPGQPAPVHTHEAPAIGYVVKGAILYQVEGQPLRTLKAGDAFYEPVGPRILRFDNASPSEEAVFIDVNLEREGDPFIRFEQPPTAKIDRRALPSTTLDRSLIGGVNVVRAEVAANQTKRVGGAAPLYVYVDRGAVELREPGRPERRVSTGESFALAKGVAATALAADGARAELIEFRPAR